MLYFALGILAWQAVTLIVFLATGQDEEKTAIIGGGIVFGFVYGACWIIRTIVKTYLNATCEAFVILREKDAFPTEHVRIRKRDVQKYYGEGENKCHIKPCAWKPSSCMNIRKIRKNGWFCQEWVDANLRKA